MRQLLQEVGVRRLANAHIVNGNAAIDSSQVIQLNLVNFRKNNVSSQVCRAYLSNYMELHPNLQVLTRCKPKPRSQEKYLACLDSKKARTLRVSSMIVNGLESRIETNSQSAMNGGGTGTLA